MTPSLTSLPNLALSAALLFWIARHLRRARDSRSWPTVQATVTAARAVRSGKGFVPRIDYAYVIEGRTYTSRRRAVSMMTVSIGRSAAEAIVAASPAGSTVVAWVDPRDRAYAVLVPGIRAGHLLLLAVGVLTLGGTIAGMVAMATLGGGGAG